MATRLSTLRLLSLIAALVITGASAWAGTKVRIATPLGNIDLELDDTDRPLTVQNFLTYVKKARFLNSFSHRLVPGFVIQGGGYYIDTTGGNYTVTPVPTLGAIKNEFNGDPKYSNVKGTITMAKVDGNVNSATSQWFLNLKDNNTGNATDGNLDLQNGGFTVFGRVIAGMDVMDAFNTSFGNSATNGRGVYDKSGALGPDMGSLPLLASDLTIGNLIFTQFTILSEEKPSIRAQASQLRVKRAVTRVAGSASPGVGSIEWRLGANGAIRKSPGGKSWQLNVTGLKRGKNLLFIRSVTTSGGQGNFQKVTIVRR